MRTLKDFFEVPLSELKEGIKLWVEHSCNFWEEWLNAKNISAAMSSEDETEQIQENPKPEPNIPDDLAAVIEYNKAIVEKYQTSGAKSLLKYLAAQLAKERNLTLEDDDNGNGRTIEDALIEELEVTLRVSDEERNLLNVPEEERVEYIATQIVKTNQDAIERIIDGDRDVVKELDEKAIKAACGMVDLNDLKFALRSVIHAELAKKNRIK